MRIAAFFALSLALAAGGCSGSVGGGGARDRDAAIADGGTTSLDGGERDGGASPDAGAIVRPEDADLGRFVLDDLEQGEIVRHGLVRMSGSIDVAASAVAASVDGDDERRWPIAGGRFKALVRLRPGDNVVHLGAGAEWGTVHLVYEPQTNPYVVRLVYLLASDGDGSFQAPPDEPSDLTSAKERIALGGELLQLYVADSMEREGMGRRTFRLPLDAEGRAVVEEFRSARSTAELHAMDGLALWSHFYDELGGLADRDRTIDVAIMSFTRFDGTTGTLYAHTALGGGRLGLFGSSAIHTWATTLDEVAASFTDERRIDTTTLHDDSAYRATYWANYATTLGATLHELGHCLSLPHPTSGSTIMSRGFDAMNRVYVAYEPSSATTTGLDVVMPADEPGWHDGNAARLRYHRYLEQDAVVHASDTPPAFARTTSAIRVTSDEGLRQIAYHVNGDIDAFEHFADAPRATFDVDLAAMRSRYGAGARLRVTAIDDEGNIGESTEVTL